MKGAVLAIAASALLGTAAAGSIHERRHAHQVFHDLRRAQPSGTSENATCGCTTYVTTYYGEATLIQPVPTIVTVSPLPATSSSAPSLNSTSSMGSTTTPITTSTTSVTSSTSSPLNSANTTSMLTTPLSSAPAAKSYEVSSASTSSTSATLSSSSAAPTVYEAVSSSAASSAPQSSSSATSAAPQSSSTAESSSAAAAKSYEAASTFAAPAAPRSSSAAASKPYEPSSSAAPAEPQSTSAAVAKPYEAASSSAAAPAAPQSSSQSPSSSTPSSTPSSNSPHSSPSPIASSGNQWCMTYSPYNADTTCKSASAVSSDISAIASKGFTSVRLYSTDCSGLSTVGAAASTHNLKLVLGVFISSTGLSIAAEQISAITTWAKGDYSTVEMIVIGNEAIFNNYCTPNGLAAFIAQAKATLAAAGYTGPVTTTEPMSMLQQHAATLCPVIDVAAANIHPFFNSRTSASAAGAFVAATLADLAALCPGGKEAYNLETGWPHAGTAHGEAVPGATEQEVAVRGISEAAGGRSAFFSFVDDLWKAPGPDGVEQSWGCSHLFGN